MRLTSEDRQPGGPRRLAAERRQAIRQLKTELGSLAVELAEQILGEALADDQCQQRLIDRFLSNIQEEPNALVRRQASC